MKFPEFSLFFPEVWNSLSFPFSRLVLNIHPKKFLKKKKKKKKVHHEDSKFSYFYCGSWIPHWILLLLSRIWDPRSSYFIVNFGSQIQILLFYCGSWIWILLFLLQIWIPDPLILSQRSITDLDPNPVPNNF
jgi:hypothetical protein